MVLHKDTLFVFSRERLVRMFAYFWLFCWKVIHVHWCFIIFDLFLYKYDKLPFIQTLHLQCSFYFCVKNRQLVIWEGHSEFEIHKKCNRQTNNHFWTVQDFLDLCTVIWMCRVHCCKLVLSLNTCWCQDTGRDPKHSFCVTDRKLQCRVVLCCYSIVMSC